MDKFITKYIDTTVVNEWFRTNTIS
jgi:hypothetical protein